MSEWGLNKAERLERDRQEQQRAAAKIAAKAEKGIRRFGRKSKKDGEK